MISVPLYFTTHKQHSSRSTSYSSILMLSHFSSSLATVIRHNMEGTDLSHCSRGCGTGRYSSSRINGDYISRETSVVCEPTSIHYFFFNYVVVCFHDSSKCTHLFIHTCTSINPSIHPSIHHLPIQSSMPIHPSIHHLPIQSSTPIHPSIHHLPISCPRLFIHPYIIYPSSRPCPFIHLFIFLCMHSSIPPFIPLSFCLHAFLHPLIHSCIYNFLHPVMHS